MRLKSAFLLFLFSFTVFADWNQVDPSDFSVMPPPAKGSDEYKRDFRILLDYQSTRTKDECALSGTQIIPSFEALFGGSEIFSSEEMEKLSPLMKKTLKCAERVTHHFKDEYMRPRPFNVDPRVKPCVEKPGGSKAYPSSHASMATLGACVLAKVYPARAQKIMEYGKFLSVLRVKVGVHHPSDVEAGQSLGLEICKQISREKDFQREIESLK